MTDSAGESLNSEQALTHHRREGVGSTDSKAWEHLPLWKFFLLGMGVIVSFTLLYGVLSVLDARVLDERERRVEELSTRRRVVENLRIHLTELEASRRVLQQARERGMAKTEEREILPAREEEKE